MKNKILFACLTIVFLFIFASCGDTPDTESSAADSSAETPIETQEETIQEMYTEKTFTMDEATYVALGRTSLSDTSLLCDHGASGVELIANCKGDVVAKINAMKDNTMFTVIVDGAVTKNVKIAKGSATYTLAKGLPEGIHTVRILNESGYDRPVAIESVTLVGQLIPGEKKDLYIEFIGDSISAGYGLGGTEEEKHDATLAYPYLAAQLLDAEYSICARSGLGVAYSAGATNIFENHYPVYNSNRGSEPYEPKEKPDLIVINLHTNDNWQWYSKGGNKEGEYYNFSTFDAKFDGIIKTIEQIYGTKKVPMVFVFGCMANPSYTLATDRSIELIETKYLDEGYDITVAILPTDRKGVESHPSAAGADLQAKALVEHIKENYPEFNIQ